MKFIDFEERKPTNLIPLYTEKGELSLSFTSFNGDEVDVLKGIVSPFEVEAKVWEKGNEEEGASKALKKNSLSVNPFISGAHSQQVQHTP